MTARLPGVLLMALGLAAVACGSDDSDDATGGLSASTTESFEGLYQLETFTRNDAGCDSPGSSVFESEEERLFVMVGSSLFGTRCLNLVSCLDETSCHDKVQVIRTVGFYIGHYGLILSEETSADELAGVVASSGFLEGDVCTERTFRSQRLLRDGERVQIESRLFPLDDAPAEDDTCEADARAQEAEAAGRPCTELLTFSGVKIGGVP